MFSQKTSIDQTTEKKIKQIDQKQPTSEKDKNLHKVIEKPSTKGFRNVSHITHTLSTRRIPSVGQLNYHLIRRIWIMRNVYPLFEFLKTQSINIFLKKIAWCIQDRLHIPSLTTPHSSSNPPSLHWKLNPSFTRAPTMTRAFLLINNSC